MEQGNREPTIDTELLRGLVERVTARVPLAVDPEREVTRSTSTLGPSLYSNRNERLGIDFAVDRVAFEGLETLDPRIVRIAPGGASERHRHAHETLFVVMEGRGDVLVGERWLPVERGDLAFVPRWVFHQTRNGSSEDVMIVLAVTDFGFTSAILGAYDAHMRLATAGEDTRAESAR